MYENQNNMKKFILLFVMMIGSIIASYGQKTTLRTVTRFDNEKLSIEQEDMIDPFLSSYQQFILIFRNKTNDILRVHYTATADFIHYGNKKVTCEKTIILQPNDLEIDTPQDWNHETLSMYRNSAITLANFKLLDYSVKKIEYEIPW